MDLEERIKHLRSIALSCESMMSLSESIALEHTIQQLEAQLAAEIRENQEDKE